MINGQVFVVGGFSGSLRVRTVDAYDPVKDTWVSCPSMKARRSTLGVALLNDLIYAVGGFDGSSGDNCLNSFICLFFIDYYSLQAFLQINKVD